MFWSKIKPMKIIPVIVLAVGLLLGCWVTESPGTEQRAAKVERPGSLLPPIDMETTPVLKKVTAEVQTRPGGPIEEASMDVFEVPVDPLWASADEVRLDDNELVLGVLVDGQAVAYPLRWLSLYEAMNDRVGDAHLTPTW